MTDGNWSDYVADAGADPAVLSEASDAMGDAAATADGALDATETAALPDAASDNIASAASDLTEASSWQQWADGDLANSAGWQDDAAGHVQTANEWAAWGNMDAAQEELNSAQTAVYIADGVAGTAATDLSIGAGYMDSASDSLADAGSDSGG